VVFAERAITTKDHRIKGITLSNEQHSFANNRLNNFKSNADIVLEDYRHQQGKFDNIVSIEMFEAVGEQYWSTYFNKLSSSLKQKGKAVVQTITIDEKHFESYRKGGDLIRSFIFPGGMLPSPERFEYEAKKAGLKITDKFHFGKDYARTLDNWLQTFNSKVAEVKALGFDDKFIRIWRLYLASCIASFSVERTDVMQVELQHA
jgi:cyclopropane-fatty-acyl-phospholipid synthase